VTHRSPQAIIKEVRTIDQMIQSARSGKQNMLEGSKAALTSKETEIKLTSVVHASLEELLADYRNYPASACFKPTAKICSPHYFHSPPRRGRAGKPKDAARVKKGWKMKRIREITPHSLSKILDKSKNKEVPNPIQSCW